MKNLKVKKIKEPLVAIIITTFNQEKLLIKCLQSLEKTDYKNYKIFFVDDSGKGEIGKEIKKKFKKIDININKKNLGFSKSNNIGIKRAIENCNPEYLLLLNDDTEIIQKDWLKKMIKVGESDNKIGILGCKIIYPNGDLQNIGGYLKKWEITKELDYKKEKIFEVDHVMGAFMLIKKNVIKKIGLLDENYSPYLLEDTDYCLNAKKEGLKIVSVPFVTIVHKKGKSIDSLEKEEIVKVRIKNDIYFSKKNLPLWSKFFRIFIYLPMALVFRKRRDEDSLSPKNFIFRKNALINLKNYFKELF